MAAALAGSALLLTGVGSAHASVTGVKGSAFGYFCDVMAIGVPCATPVPTPPSPTVTLAPDASNSPQVATAASGSAKTGPATVFSSGPITVSTQGALGARGSATSSTNISNINTSGFEVFTAAASRSTCTAGESVTASTSITGGTLQTDSGDSDPNNSIPNHPPVSTPLDPSPTPNKPVAGHVHIGNTTDDFLWVFNEQNVNIADGSLTVSAAHEYSQGPTATGNLIIGQAVCGLTGRPDPLPPPTTPQPPTPSTSPHRQLS